ncbi:NAD(P)H azoreductase [Microbulbifer sp. NBRC 101763]|uniref:SDR family oxidoreductase n=1 Tax=Microbulbifer TaxID=48073 RepID=UPI00037BCFBD|nr:MULTISPECIES: SDR family oxidoreductase [Microbulbifer]WHI49287.1 SDR family oxidoreductase [Microbulbifer sp. MLAF003]
MEKILITGGTGNNGKAVLKNFANTNIPVRALLRDLSRAPIVADNISYVIGDYENESSLLEAMQGIETAFLVTAFEPSFTNKHAAFIRIAEQAGVKHIVQISGLGADKDSPIDIARWLGEAEEHLIESTLNWTILQPASFNSNFFASAEEIAQQSTISAPFGSAPGAAIVTVDHQDIGDIAAKILVEPGEHIGKKYILTGAEKLTYTDISNILSEVLQRKITYQPISDEAARSGLLSLGVSERAADALAQLWPVTREWGHTIELSNHVEQLLDRKPTLLKTFFENAASQFSKKEV